MGEDPAAEFLQQENDQLRELGLGIEEAQFNATPDPFNDQFNDQFNAPAAVAPPEFVPEEFVPEEEVAAAAPVVTNDNFMEEFETELETPQAPQDTLVNGFTDLGVTESPPIIAPQPIHQIVPNEEPESLIQWREEKAALLQQQEKDEQEASVAWAEKAKKEMDDWYNRYNEQLEKVKNENRAAEDQFIEEMTDTKPGNEWEKVARFCDFNPKFSKNTKDVSRMRSLLLQLKQNPLVR